MNLKDYKMCRSKNFPLPNQNLKKKSSHPSHNVQTIGLVSTQQSNMYHLHHDEQKSDLIMFGAYEYIRRNFDYIIHEDQPKSKEEGMMLKTVLRIVEEKLASKDRNLFILPVLDCEPIDRLIFPHVGFALPENSSVPETPDSIIKTVINSLLKSKRKNTVISLSIMGIQANGTLRDELDYEWLEETDDIQKAMRQKMPLKLTKQKNEVKTFELNRQHITTWEQANEILFYYHQLSQNLEYWKDIENVNDVGCHTGVLYELSEVEVDPEYGSILTTVQRCYVLRVNQYLKESNLMMMRITQSLHELVTNIKSKNTRDYPLMMLLSDCFQPKSEWQISLFTQVGTNQTIKEEAVCMEINLQVPGRHVYLKNYHDDKKVAQEVKQFGVNFNSAQENPYSTRRSERSKMNDKALRLLRESQKVAIKSFIRETYSSYGKRKVLRQGFRVQTILQPNSGLNGGNEERRQSAVEGRVSILSPIQQEADQ